MFKFLKLFALATVVAQKCQSNVDFVEIRLNETKTYMVDENNNFDFKFEFDSAKNNMTSTNWQLINILDF